MECYLYAYHKLIIKQPQQIIQVYLKYKDLINSLTIKKVQGTIKIFLAKFLTTYVLLLIENKFHSDLLYIG